MYFLSLISSVADEMGLRKYVTAEVARDALKDYLHLSIREWKMKLQLAIAMKACDSYRGDHIVIRTEDMKPLVHEEKKCGLVSSNLGVAYIIVVGGLYCTLFKVRSWHKTE